MRWAFLLAALLFGCAERPTPLFMVAVRVESDPGVGLPNATLATHGRQLGVTDATGVTVATLAGVSGETIELNVDCPEGFRAPSAPLQVRLRPSKSPADRPEYRVACPPLQRRLVLAVKTDGAQDLAVRVLGEQIARTDRFGGAHALLNVAPGDVVVVKLDTSAQETLMPRDPELRVVMPERDELVLFQQTFTKPKPKRAPRPKAPEEPTPI
ncbi:MAG: hypothetical protein ABW352_14570 [Polyangiales bacterium]